MLPHRRLLLTLNLILLSILLLFFLQKRSFQSISADYCRKNKIKINEEFYAHVVYIPELQILYCDVPKAASSNLRRLLYVYFNQSKSFEDLDRQKIWLDEKMFFNKFYLTENSQSIHKNESLFKFLVVRHPFQRIYATYYDKFVNTQSEDTISGWSLLEEDILLEMKTTETLLTIRRKDLRVDLRTFLLYIIASIRNKRKINSHWEQIAHRCGVCRIDYEWIGKIENFHEDQKVLLKKFHRQDLQFPSETLDRKGDKPPVFNDLQLIELFRTTIKNDDAFQVLIDYYKADFQLFDYTLPNV